MAGNWIPICEELPTRREVLILARLGECSPDVIVGRLVVFWLWAGRETADGQLPGLTCDDVAMACGLPLEFVLQLARPEIDWLRVSEQGVELPRFGTWNGQSAKRRLNRSRGRDTRRQASASSEDTAETEPAPAAAAPAAHQPRAQSAPQSAPSGAAGGAVCAHEVAHNGAPLRAPGAPKVARKRRRRAPPAESPSPHTPLPLRAQQKTLPPPPHAPPAPPGKPPDTKQQGGGGGSAARADPDGQTWRDVARQLLELGVADAVAAIDQAQAAGLQVAEAAAILEHYAAHVPRWGPGALHYRLRRAVPGRPPDKDWPAPADRGSNSAEQARRAAAERVSRASQAGAIIRRGRQAGQTDSQIEQQLAAAGRTWEDVDGH